ncbi:MAG: glycosyltransferase family 39 protein [Candidatus Promineifilaceae bacterium]|nr:glycosyltransferase family 39 protein [Candidatus Promineifilaceae bacterium]
MPRRITWLLLIFLVAAALRLSDLSDTPPGLTHDEADHGVDAWGVVNGIRPLYFTVGFGREPLYDYATAGLMSFLGPHYLAGRLTAAFFSLITLAGVYAWTRQAFDERTALFAAAGVAVSFWAVMTGRQALRSVTLPALFALAAFFFWRGLRLTVRWKSIPWPPFLVGGLLLGLSFYTYVPARALWLSFPLLLFYLTLVDRPFFRRVWPGTALMLLVALVVALPLIGFLAANPQAETRLGELSQPLWQALGGEWAPLLTNIRDGLAIIAFEGDHQWRYNLPGRPLLAPGMALTAFAGLFWLVWRLVSSLRAKRAERLDGAACFALIWLGLGLAPALITGPELSTTQAIGLLPVLYVFPAVTLSGFWSAWPHRRRLVTGLIVIFFAALAINTTVSYFYRWARSPEVRVQYESAMVAAVRSLAGEQAGAGAISTTTPGRFHSPAVGFLVGTGDQPPLRWFDGRHSLLLPAEAQGQSLPLTVIFSRFASLNPQLAPYFAGVEAGEVTVPETDLDRPLTRYRLDADTQASAWRRQMTALDQPVRFGQAASLLGYVLQTPTLRPGDELRLVSLWQAQHPLPDAVLFSHLLGDDGRPLAQDDRLDVRGYGWHAGDLFLQLHTFLVPSELPSGRYELAVGLYTQPDLQRLPAVVGDQTVGDLLPLPTLVEVVE